MDSKLHSLVHWSKAQGAQIDSRLDLLWSIEAGVSAYYDPSPADVGKTLEFGIKIPTTMILKADDAQRYFEAKWPGFHSRLPPLAIFKAYLAYLLKDPCKTPYFDLLPTPEEIHSPITYNEQEMDLLEGTNLHKGTQWKLKVLRAQYDLFIEDTGSDITFDDYLWGHLIVSSRAFPLKIVDPTVDSSAVMLLPLVDLMNHEPMSKVTWGFDGHNFTVDVCKPITSADRVQVCNNYGPKGNEELLLAYGFVLPGNPFDCLQLSLNEASLRPLIGDANLSDWQISKLPKLADYTYSVVSNVYADAKAHEETDMDDGFVVFMCNRDHPIPAGLLELFTLISRNQDDLGPTLKARLNGIVKLRQSLDARFKDNLDVMPKDTGCDSVNYSNCRIYREGQLDVYNRAKRALKQEEKSLLKTYRKQLVTIKDIRKDEEFEPFLEVFGLQGELNKFQMELAVHLWLFKEVNDAQTPWINEEWAKVKESSFEQDPFLVDLYNQAIGPLDTSSFPGDHWDLDSFLRTDLLYRCNSYEKGTALEPIVIEPTVLKEN